MSNFTHLHVHSQYSVMDGLNTPLELMNAAKNLGQTAIAITDHGTLSSHRHMQKAAMETGIKPILGVEAYISATDRFDKRDTSKRDDNTSIFNHIILLAKNKTGLKNLNKLSEMAWTGGYYHKPRIDREILAVAPLLGFGFLKGPGMQQTFAVAFLWGALALTYDLLFGFTGLLSFGHALFFASGVFPPVDAAKSTITLPLRIDCTISSVMRIGAFLPGICAVVMTISAFATAAEYQTLIDIFEAWDDIRITGNNLATVSLVDTTIGSTVTVETFFTAPPELTKLGSGNNSLFLVSCGLTEV